jgi:hypothetical protein
MMKMKYIQTGLILSLLYFGCSRNKGDDILLQAGDYKLTVADYEYFKSRQKKQSANSVFRDQLVKNAYILAYAMDKRFDTIRVLAKKLSCAEHLYASDVDGYVWNRKVKPLLKVDSDDIKAAYEKRKTLYTLEYIYFPDSISLNGYIKHGQFIESVKGFNRLKGRVSSSLRIKSGTFRGTYPFYPLGVYTNRITDAKKGDVWGPFEALDGYYIVQVTGMESALQHPLTTDEKARIEKELLNTLKLNFILESQQEVLGSMAPAMHDSAIIRMAEKFISGKKEWPGIDPNMVLMDYTFRNQIYHYTAADFMEFIRYQPMYVGSPANAGDMKKMMTNFLMEVWYYDEALKMGAGTDEKFRCFKKYYQSKLFVGYYHEKNIYPTIKLMSDTLKRYYNKNQDKFQCPGTATISIYKFGNQQAALKAMMPLIQYYKNMQNQGGNNKPPKFQGMNSYQEDIKIQMADTTNQAMLVRAILDADSEKVLSPREIDGEYWIVYLARKEGKALLPYKYARRELQHTLLDQKTQDVRNRLLAGLKAQYPLKVDRLKEYEQKTDD